MNALPCNHSICGLRDLRIVVLLAVPLQGLPHGSIISVRVLGAEDHVVAVGDTQVIAEHHGQIEDALGCGLVALDLLGGKGHLAGPHLRHVAGAFLI